MPRVVYLYDVIEACLYRFILHILHTFNKKKIERLRNLNKSMFHTYNLVY